MYKPCYVLEDETRVLSQRGVVVGGLGIRYGGGSVRGGADRLTSFLQGNAISPFVSKDLLALVQNPIRFRSSGGLAHGYPKLREHLGAVVATMKLSADWYDFKAKLDKNYPRQGKPTQLSFDYAEEEEEDTGKGL